MKLEVNSSEIKKQDLKNLYELITKVDMAAKVYSSQNHKISYLSKNNVGDMVEKTEVETSSVLFDCFGRLFELYNIKSAELDLINSNISA